ncbi:hypothetical protein Cgig2_020216 [Carnegiea gigantea]|uniref:Translation initiation factor eIF2B subunit gamma n=1 Tax=Carnegiea gigantea TaxID=171969 RepID=A0A9Q1KX89_9CARY|nr:hypothetical protein Cgig2_020216 [Carnegiea gigantea]
MQVVAVPEDKGTAGALRAISRQLTASDILVMSGDLVSDVPPGAVAAAHRRHDAVVTAMLCSTPVSGPTESVSAGGKDKAKKPARCNIIGLDVTKQFLLHIASGTEVNKDIRVQKSILRAVGQMDIRTDLMDAHLYAFKRSVLQGVLDKDLDQKEKFQSLKKDVLPYLVRTQLRSEVVANSGAQVEENGNYKMPMQQSQVMLSQLLANASTPSFHELFALGPNGAARVPKRTHKCCVYIAPKDKYCAQLNSIQAYSDINRDIIGEANHLSGCSFSPQNNFIHPSAELGSKSTVGPHCMLGEGSQMGDKCSVKRSVIGCHCRIGSNVKIANSVVMNHVTIADGCSIQGSVICSTVQLQERVILRDCQVMPCPLILSLLPLLPIVTHPFPSIALNLDSLIQPRWEQVLWSPLVVNTKGNLWQRKRRTFQSEFFAQEMKKMYATWTAPQKLVMHDHESAMKTHRIVYVQYLQLPWDYNGIVLLANCRPN